MAMVLAGLVISRAFLASSVCWAAQGCWPAPSYLIVIIRKKRESGLPGVSPQMQSRERKMEAPTLDLPPPFRLVRLREMGGAFEHAKAIAAEEGAGTVVHVGRFDLAE